MDSLLTPKELSEMLSINQVTVYRWFDQGKFGDAARIISAGERKRTIRFIPEKIKELFNLV